MSSYLRPAPRKHFWQETSRGDGGVRCPEMYGLSGTIPATVKRSDGSSWGISEELGRRRCPFSSKKRRKRSLISGLRTPVSRGWNAADSTRGCLPADSDRGGIAELAAQMVHRGALQ